MGNMHRESGGWDCFNYGRKGNFGTKSTCRCGHRKGTLVSPKKESGDWDCPNCPNRGNFGTKTVCRCGYSRVTKGTVRIGNSDWNCACGYLNFRNNTQCRSCKIPKGAQPTQTPPIASTCKVCLDGALEVLLPCGHICACLICATAMDKCPMCRVAYAEGDVKRIYI